MARTLTDEDLDAVAERVVTLLSIRLGAAAPALTAPAPVSTVSAPAPAAPATSPTLPPEKLAFTNKELTAAIGLSASTLWRLEARGFLKTVPGIRHKLYARRDVERFLAGEKPVWAEKFRSRP